MFASSFASPALILERKIFIEFDFHQICGVAGTGRSSSADATAKAMAALTSSALRLGKSPRMSSWVSPAARLANTVRNVTRVPLKTGSPPQIAGSRRIRSSTFVVAKELRIIGRGDRI